jgi:hypothetical protein
MPLDYPTVFAPSALNLSPPPHFVNPGYATGPRAYSSYRMTFKFHHLPVIIETNISKENYHAFLLTVNHYFGKWFFSTKFHRLKN